MTAGLLATGAVLATGFMTQAAIAANTHADPNGNLIGLTTPNGKLVYNFINLWFNEHKPYEAFDQYVARKGYMNHAVYNSTTATADKTFDQEKAEEARAAGPGTHFDIKQIVAQGNLVFVHIAATNNGGVGAATGKGAGPAAAAPGGAGAPAAGPGGPGPQGDGKGPDEMVMILRVHNGKIVDHWDMHIPTNSNSVVFAGLDRKLP